MWCRWQTARTGNSALKHELGGAKTKRDDLAELHDDVHHVALLVTLIILDNVGVVQAVQHLHLVLSLNTKIACLHSEA